MDTLTVQPFAPILSVMTAKVSATTPEWKALLKLLPPRQEVKPLFKKIADNARFFDYARLTNDYINAQLLVACCAARNVGGSCEFNVGQRAALTFVLSAHTGTLTKSQKNIVSAVLMDAEEICGPVNAMLYDIAVKSDPERAADVGLEAFVSSRQLLDDINAFWELSND